MGTPINIRSLFSQRSDDDDAEPAWLSTHEDKDEPDQERAPSVSSDDPFDVAIVSPSKTGKPTTDDTAANEEAGPSTSRAHSKTAEEFPDIDDAEQDPTLKAKPVQASAGNKSSKPPSTQVSLKIPASLKCLRLLVELPGEKETAVDLTGDSGAVGRLSIQSNSGGKEILLDLKGVMYKASLLPMACTACVVNVGQTDAKVEAFCNEFLQLEKSTVFGDGEVLEDGTLDDWVLQDNDHDVVHVAGKDGGDAAKGKGGKPKQAKSKQGAMGVSSGKVVKVVSKKKSQGGSGAKGKGTRKPKRK